MSSTDILTFDEASHTYRFRGMVVPGVTSVLSPLSDFSRINPEVLAAKADLGKRVHMACEFDDDGDLDEGSVEEDVGPYLTAYRRFKSENGVLVLLNEHQVFDAGLMYAGTLDRVMVLNRSRWLVDLKTCFTTPRSAGPQTAAYLRALNDPTVARRAALRLKPDGTYAFEPLTAPDDWAIFMACLTLHRFNQRLAA